MKTYVSASIIGAFLMILLSSNISPKKYRYIAAHEYNPHLLTEATNFSPQKFYDKQCAFCHNERGKIGPPMGVVKKAYLEKYKNKDTVVLKMTAFILNPTDENRLITNNTGTYGTMPKNMFTDARRIERVVEYILKTIKVTDKKAVNSTRLKKNRKINVNLSLNKGMDLCKILHLKQIDFEYASKTIEPKMQVQLHKIFVFLRDNPSIRIEIGNHTDSRGRADLNKKLSLQRANIIKDYLVKQGIDSKRIKTKGYGETQLINHCSDGVECTEEQHRQNRRTEFIII